MPSPNRGTDDSKIAYTRWEPLEATAEDPDEPPINESAVVPNNNNHIPFHHFEEDRGGISIIHRNRRSHKTSWSKWYDCGIKTLGILILMGLAWIFGFMTRWGVHHYYIDSMGHCVTPVPYHYNAETAKLILEEVNLENIKDFLNDFISAPSHQIGSQESHNFARNISETWKDFGMPKVEINEVKNKVPRPDPKIPSEISITDPEGQMVFNLVIPQENDLVQFTPSAFGTGKLVYGHYGKYEDFTNLKRLHNMNFTNSVVMIKVNNLYHTGSMVRNAQMMGAKAVILFPDPFPYILSNDHEKIGKLPSNVTLNTDVKFVPGDPNSPYLDNEWTMPDIPVIGINYDQAKEVLFKFTNAYGVSHEYWYGLPLNTSVEMNFTAQVRVYRDDVTVTLKNVIATIPGRYEPTRYIIVASHHDSWHNGAARPGIGHAVLMELVRTLGYESLHGWKPGRSIIFASWDGEEYGQLGSTAWLYAHSKELSSRAVVYIDLDHLLQGNDKIHITASPLLKQVIVEAASSIECPSNPKKPENAQQEDQLNAQHCTLLNLWMNQTSVSMLQTKNNSLSVDGSPFQSIFGISSLEVAMKNEYQGDAYPFIKTHYDTLDQVETFLDLSQATAMAQFMIVLILKLVMSPKLPLSAPDYGRDVEAGIQEFLGKYANSLDSHGIPILDLKSASEKFSHVAKQFNNTFDLSIPSLELLSYHEYNDQLMELERAFLLPPSSSSSFFVTSGTSASTSTYRHVIHGPSPLDSSQIDFLPRLRAALDVAKASQDNDEAWNVVKREAFFVVDALESAACVLENHLIEAVAVERNSLIS